jgi:hypothetical protein
MRAGASPGPVATRWAGWATAGVVLAGALTGLAAAPLARAGSSRRRPAGHRPASSTWAAALLLVAAAVAAVWVWIAELGATGGGLDSLVLMWLGGPVAVGSAVLIVVALGLLRRRGWARWATVVGFSLGAVAALSGLLGTVHVGAGIPPAELARPAVALAVSVAVVVLALVPATARDFRSARRPPTPRRPGSS